VEAGLACFREIAGALWANIRMHLLSFFRLLAVMSLTIIKI
jgi:hypothetical protein